MLLHISEQAAETLQEQIVDQIRARILSGALTANSALPSIRSLAKDLRVSVITVQRAYDSLLNENLIYARRGKGYFVADLPNTDKASLAGSRFEGRLNKLISEAKREGLSKEDVERLFRTALDSMENQDA
jgi:GntR family transcriptional regulator